MKNIDRELLKAHAQICKGLANEKRLLIIEELGEKTNSFGELVEKFNLKPSNLAQHLLVLKGLGIIKSEQKGKYVFYSLTDTRVLTACRIMREVLTSNIRSKSKLLKGGVI